MLYSNQTDIINYKPLRMVISQDNQFENLSENLNFNYVPYEPSVSNDTNFILTNEPTQKQIRKKIENERERKRVVPFLQLASIKDPFERLTQLIRLAFPEFNHLSNDFIYDQIKIFVEYLYNKYNIIDK